MKPEHRDAALDCLKAILESAGQADWAHVGTYIIAASVIEEARAVIERESVSRFKHRDAGWLAQLAEKDRQIQALQAAYEDTRDSLHRALAALAEHDARYRQQVQAKAERYHEIARRL